MNIQNIPLTDIHPYARNPRKNDEAVKSVAASSREFGCLVPWSLMPAMSAWPGTPDTRQRNRSA